MWLKNRDVSPSLSQTKTPTCHTNPKMAGIFLTPAGLTSSSILCKPLQKGSTLIYSHVPVGGWQKGGQRCEGRIIQNITTFSNLRLFFMRWTGAHVARVCVTCTEIQTRRALTSCWEMAAKGGNCVGGMFFFLMNLECNTTRYLKFTAAKLRNKSFPPQIVYCIALK